MVGETSGAVQLEIRCVTVSPAGERSGRKGLGSTLYPYRFLVFFSPLSVGQLALVVTRGQRRSVLLLAVPIYFIAEPLPRLTYLSFLGTSGRGRAAALPFQNSRVALGARKAVPPSQRCCWEAVPDGAGSFAPSASLGSPPGRVAGCLSGAAAPAPSQSCGTSRPRGTSKQEKKLWLGKQPRFYFFFSTLLIMCREQLWSYKMS